MWRERQGKPEEWLIHVFRIPGKCEIDLRFGRTRNDAELSFHFFNYSSVIDSRSDFGCLAKNFFPIVMSRAWWRKIKFDFFFLRCVVSFGIFGLRCSINRRQRYSQLFSVCFPRPIEVTAGKRERVFVEKLSFSILSKRFARRFPSSLRHTLSPLTTLVLLLLQNEFTHIWCVRISERIQRSIRFGLEVGKRDTWNAFRELTESHPDDGFVRPLQLLIRCPSERTKKWISLSAPVNIEWEDERKRWCVVQLLVKLNEKPFEIECYSELVQRLSDFNQFCGNPNTDDWKWNET